MQNGDMSWDAFRQVIPSLIGGVVVADDSSAYEHVCIIDKIFEEPPGYLHVLPVPGTVRAVLSDEDSTPDHSERFLPGWGANMDYTTVVVSDDMFIYNIPLLGRVFLYPPGHPEIRSHWLPLQLT
jgi:hypothetical protein